LDKIKNEKIKKLEIDSQKKANQIRSDLETTNWRVAKISEEERKKYPYPPYTTATLQRDAAHRLKFSAKKTMYLAQKLYEGILIEGESHGLITYMRTDSFNLANEAIDKAREYINEKYSSDLPDKSKRYKSRQKRTQEAHEAIRPTDPTRTPESVKKYLTKDQLKLYQLIWQRMIACQMNPIKYNTIKATIKAGKDYQFVAKGRYIEDPGFSKVYSVKFKEANIPK